MEEHFEEGESSSTSAKNLVTDTAKSNTLEIDRTEAQSTTLELSSGQEMIEVRTQHVSQQYSGTRLSNSTSPAISSAHLFASAMVDGAEGGYGNMNIDEDMMNFNPPNHYASSSQILFPSQVGMGSLMSEDNAYNNGRHQTEEVISGESSYWALNGYQFPTTNLSSDHFPLVVAPTTPSAIHLSNIPQETMGGGSSQYLPGFLQIHSTDPFGAEEMQFHGLLNQGPSNGTFYSTDLSTIQFPQTRLNLEDGLPSSSNLHLSRHWISEGNVLSNATTPPTSRSAESRNAVYDPTYESMGLPIDPHLRLFLSWRDSTGDAM